MPDRRPDVTSAIAMNDDDTHYLMISVRDVNNQVHALGLDPASAMEMISQLFAYIKQVGYQR